MRATYACGVAIGGDATIDDFGDKGRVRTSVDMLVARSARVRLSAVVPVVGNIGTLTSDGSRFSLDDVRNKRFLVGPASACNLARITRMQLPASVLVDLLRGQAPVLVHDAPAVTMEWSGSGYFIVRVPSTRDASEEIHITPSPDDWTKPWSEQRLRVLDVKVWQGGVLLYHAELDDHVTPPMAQLPPSNAMLNAILGQTPSAPLTLSGPVCDAEVPRRVHIDLPIQGEDVLFRYDKAVWNPPLEANAFTQDAPLGMPVQEVTCE